MLALLRSPETEARLAPPDWTERGAALAWLRRLLPDRLEYLLIRIGLLLNALIPVVVLVLIALIASGEVIVDSPDQVGPIQTPDEPVWWLLLGLVWLIVGVASAVALGLSLVGRHDRALSIALYSLLLMLVAGGILDVYASQLGALANVLFQLALLVLVLDQRSRRADQARSRTAQ